VLVVPLEIDEGTKPLLRLFEDERVCEGPVFMEPFRDMLLVTELLEAEELDLLRFSFELLGLPDEFVAFLDADIA